MNDKKSTFLPLMLPQKEAAIQGAYRVYNDRVNFHLVEAGTALEALQKSGLKQAYKIERNSLYSTHLLTLNPDKLAVNPAPEPELQTQVEDLVSAKRDQQITKEQALSNDDVEKLLQPE